MRVKVLLIGILMLSASLAGCFKDDAPPLPPPEPTLPDGVFIPGPDGESLSQDLYQPLNHNNEYSSVGEDGAEPSLGVTSSGCIFFIAFEKVMRSCDHGESWEGVAGAMCA